jgi:hypothetical protein
MNFTVSIDMADGGYFEFCTSSIVRLAEIAHMMGNLEVVSDEEEECEEEECEEIEEFEELDENIVDFFDEGEEYVYDEDFECFCWYDEEYDAWYWLNEDTGEWLLVEDEEEAE